MPRPISAVIHLDALAHNLTVAQRHAAGAKVWAVVKANAYGHGIERVYPALRHADGFALLDVAEAAQLRRLGWSGPILLLEGLFDPSDLLAIDQLRLTPVIHHARQLDWLAAGSLSAPIDVYCKLNSGMNRLGFQASAFDAACERLKAMPQVKSVTAMTHFANADAPQEASSSAVPPATQRAVLAEHAAGCGEASLSNSAAIFRYAGAGGAWVRAGILLYGGSPLIESTAAALDLHATMSLRSQLIAVQALHAGDAVGYGSRYIAAEAMRIGVVACGYADGYPRHAPNGTPVIVDGQRCLLVGRVSMDMLTVDLTSAPEADIGSAVELWGKQLPIDEVAAAARTISYELMCALAPRVPVMVAKD